MQVLLQHSGRPVQHHHLAFHHLELVVPALLKYSVRPIQNLHVAFHHLELVVPVGQIGCFIVTPTTCGAELVGPPRPAPPPGLPPPRMRGPELRTPRQAQEQCVLTPLEPWEYCHFGLKAGLLRILCHVEHPPSVIPLSFNIDGLPLSKSSKMQLWPIQCIAHGCGDGTPFLVGAFAGLSKPASSWEFLRPFVVELQELISEGVAVDGSVAQVSMAYAIVEFLALREVEVVPSTWIKGNRCAWPPEHIKGDKIVTMVKKAAMPDASWKCLELSVKGLFGTYELARRKLNRSERDSDLNKDSDVPRKRSRKPPQPWSDSDDSEASQTPAKTQQKGAVPVPRNFPLGLASAECGEQSEGCSESDFQELASLCEKDTSCVGQERS
ncbi:uncharacterized protein [Dermacentor andersoni]|uniref:uncharacterized protein n=1 Tax=Dermacentor andersoni TaxID=34620 RepID=UPI002416B2ED|nr:uncharacterized protein LOC126538342 [Dermacentor andersoni]